MGRFGFSRAAPFLYVFDKDVLFTSVMTFFHASIEMERPPPPSECLPWFSPGRSRHEVSQGVHGVGFPRVFTAWVSQGLHGVGFPRSSRRVGAAFLFPFAPSRHGMACSSLGLRSSAPLSRARVRGSGSRGNALVSDRLLERGTQCALPPIPAFPTKASAYSRFACINGRHTTGIGRKPWNRG